MVEEKVGKKSFHGIKRKSENNYFLIRQEILKGTKLGIWKVVIVVSS